MKNAGGQSPAGFERDSPKGINRFQSTPIHGMRQRRPEQMQKAAIQRPSKIRRWLSVLGPGVITGAADDDPSGIATYSVAGAQFGNEMLWTALLTWPLMAAVQMTCARIGMVTGAGMAGAFRKKFPKPILAVAVFALLAANTINVGADLSGMADAAEMLTGMNSHLFVFLFGGIILWATIRFSYRQIASVLKWLCLVLFAYVVTAFMVKPDWSKVIHGTLIPAWPKGHEQWSTLVAILGTTISPYLFFWQSAQEVEEEKSMGRRLLVERQGAKPQELDERAWDVGIGTFFSNLVMFFIIVTTAATLHSRGMTHIQTSREAAEALRPLAGQFAALLYTLGVIGTGTLAIPVLAGSAAYAFAETFKWGSGLDRKFKRAKPFYGVIIVSVTVGILMDYLKINPVKALYWAAVINGLLAPFLLVGIALVASDKKLMQQQRSPRMARVVIWITALLLLAAAVGMFAF